MPKGQTQLDLHHQLIDFATNRTLSDRFYSINRSRCLVNGKVNNRPTLSYLQST